MARAALLQDYDDDTSTASVKEAVPNQFVTFTCGARAFGIDIMRVREIRSWSPITELPNQPFGARGVLDIRGNIVRVYDLTQLVGGDSYREDKNDQVVLVVSLKTQDVGLLVDAVSDIIFAQGDDLRPVPGSNGNGQDTAVLGLVRNEDRLIAILNLAALFPGETEADDLANA